MSGSNCDDCDLPGSVEASNGKRYCRFHAFSRGIIDEKGTAAVGAKKAVVIRRGYKASKMIRRVLKCDLCGKMRPCRRDANRPKHRLNKRCVYCSKRIADKGIATKTGGTA